MEGYVPGLVVTTPQEVIKEVASLLSVEERWARRRTAKTKTGEECSPSDKEATSWCLIGALHRVLGANLWESDERTNLFAHASDILDSAMKKNYKCYSLSLFNDTARYEEVKDLLEKALESSKEEEEIA